MRNKVKKADWILPATGVCRTFTEVTGRELDNLKKTMDNSNGMNAIITSLKFVYNHIEDANNPEFSTWAKTIRYSDIESLYFGIYRATYSGTNLIGYLCEKEENKKV